jgi:hypothetical protein
MYPEFLGKCDTALIYNVYCCQLQCFVTIKCFKFQFLNLVCRMQITQIYYVSSVYMLDCFIFNIYDTAFTYYI